MERKDYVVINATISKYKNLFDFHEDMGMVSYDTKYGFIDKEGREVVKTIYDDAKDYSNNYAAVKKNDKWFFINKKGEKVSLEYDFVHSFKNGLAIVEKDSKWGIINTKFEEVVPIIYDSIDYPSEDLILVSLNGRLKYIDLNNEVKIELSKSIKRAYSFKEGIARVENDNYKTGYIDKSGKNVADFIYSAGTDFTNSLAGVSSKEGSTIIYKNGEELFPKTRDFTINSRLSNGNYEVSLGFKKWTLMNHLASLVMKKTYSHMYFESEGLIRVQDENNNYGFIDINGNEIIPPVLDYADDFSEGVVVVRNQEGKYGYMDRYGTLVIPFMYDSARSFSNNMAIVKLDGHSFYIDITNKPLKTEETKESKTALMTPTKVPPYVQGYDINRDFVSYRTEVSVGPDWAYRVIETRDINACLEHEDKVLELETELVKSMEELVKVKTLK